MENIQKVRNFPLRIVIQIHKSVGTLYKLMSPTQKHNVPYGTHSHFFEGVNLTGGIPLFGQLDHLGVDGISTGSPLVMEG